MLAEDSNMAFWFPVDEAASKITDKMVQNAVLDEDDVADIRQFVNRSDAALLNAVVDLVAHRYVTNRLSRLMGSGKRGQSVAASARSMVREVRPGRNKSRSACLAKFRDVCYESEGSYGVVQSGRQKGIKYAIKRVPLNAQNHDDQELARLRIENEIKITRFMSEKGIGPKLHDAFVCTTDTSVDLYLVLEWFNQSSLDEYIRSFTLTKQDMTAISNLITKMHDNGVLHNDLHTSNILVHRESDGSLKFAIGDFGQSTFASSAALIQRHRDRSKLFDTATIVSSADVKPVVWLLLLRGDITVSFDSAKPYTVTESRSQGRDRELSEYTRRSAVRRSRGRR